MNVQLLKIINGPKPQTALALIIQDDGSLDNPGQLILDDFSGPKLESRKIFYNGDSIYDIWVSPKGDIWACSSYAEDPELEFSGLTYALDQIILAAGKKGVYVIEEGKLVNIRNTFNAEMVAGEGAQAVFIRPGKDDGERISVAYAIYNTSEDRPWSGYTFYFAKE